MQLGSLPTYYYTVSFKECILVLTQVITVWHPVDTVLSVIPQMWVKCFQTEYAKHGYREIRLEDFRQASAKDTLDIKEPGSQEMAAHDFT